MIGLEAPLALLALGALAVPVLLHVLVRRSPPLVVLPTARFLEALPRPRRRPAPPRDVLVLAARLLGLSALVIAAARPFTASEAAPARGTPPLVLVLDDTLSMAHGAPSRLDRARALLLARLDRLGPGARAALLLATHPEPRLETVAEVRARLVAVCPQPRSASLLAALEAAAGLVRESPGALVVCASDFDRASVACLEQRSVLARALAPEVLDVGDDEPRNAWLSGLEVLPRTPVAGFPLAVRARVSAVGLDAAAEAPVSLELAGGARDEARARPGESVRFEIARPAPGPLEGTLRVRAAGDRLALDDALAFGCTVLPRLDVLVAGEDPAAVEPVARAVRALGRARGAAIEVARATPSELPRALARARVLVLAAPGPLDRETQGALARFLDAGNGLVALLGAGSREPAAVWAGSAWSPAAVRAPVSARAGATRADPARLEPDVGRGLEALSLAPEVALEPAPGAAVVLRDAAGEAIWVERGRVALLGFALTGANEGLSRETVFPLIVGRALEAALGAWGEPGSVTGVPEIESRLERAGPSALGPALAPRPATPEAGRQDRAAEVAGAGLALLALAALLSSVTGERRPGESVSREPASSEPRAAEPGRREAA